MNSVQVDRANWTLTADLRQRLQAFGVEALEAMYQPDAGLFPFTLRQGKNGVKPEGTSIRYTAVSLLGLRAAQRAGVQTNLDMRCIMNRLIERLDQTENIGDVGLIAWADGEDSGAHTEPLLERIERHGEFFQTPRSRLYASMELQWLLMGLLALSSKTTQRSRVAGLVDRAYRDLAANYHSNSGLFRFARRASTRQSKFKRDLCFFAEQIYGIQALALYSVWSGDREALAHACRTANHVCDMQGRRGQWAWAYHAATGKILERYPVYSVHQHGMAPMSLARLSAISGKDFFTPALRGFQWIMGNNELETPMVRSDQRIIWRSIRRRRACRDLAKFHKVLALLGLPIPRGIAERSPSLEIDRECRPYELGWMLVALSEKWP